MLIKGTISGATAPVDVDCIFYDASDVEVFNYIPPPGRGYFDGFDSLYNLTANYEYPMCAPLNSATEGVPPTATKFECVVHASGVVDAPEIGRSVRQPVSAGVKTANIVVDNSSTTTTTSSTTSTTGNGSTSTTTTGTGSSSTSTTSSGSSSTSTSLSSTTTTTLPATCEAGCEDNEPCTDDSCPDATCANVFKLGLPGVQCRCDRPLPGACLGQTPPHAVTTARASACRALNKISTDTTGKRLKRLVSSVRRGTNKAGKSSTKAVNKGKLTADCGNALATQFSEIQSGADGLLNP